VSICSPLLLLLLLLLYHCPAAVEFVFRTGFMGEADMAQGINSRS
jgi:hypothetical protein